MPVLYPLSTSFYCAHCRGRQAPSGGVAFLLLAAGSSPPGMSAETTEPHILPHSIQFWERRESTLSE